jgi:hypothetical protein
MEKIYRKLYFYMHLVNAFAINILVYTSCGQNQKLRISCGHPTKRLHTSCGHSKYTSSIYGIYHAILFTKKFQHFPFHFIN